MIEVMSAKAYEIYKRILMSPWGGENIKKLIKQYKKERKKDK